MKKPILAAAFIAMMLTAGLTTISAQEQPAPQKDTVNMDTDAKPTQYYDIEDDKAVAGGKSSVSMLLILGIVGAVVVVGGAAYFLLKKKK